MKVEEKSRHQPTFSRDIPGFGSAILIGTRESRRVEGEYTLIKQDIFEGKTFL
ncbi:MAG: hypothetical protein QXU81_07545 [Candidatus Bathyarchaeia archaeon]